MSKQGVLLGAFYSRHMLRARPRRVWLSATRQATTTSNAERENFGTVISAMASMRSGFEA